MAVQNARPSGNIVRIQRRKFFIDAYNLASYIIRVMTNLSSNIRIDLINSEMKKLADGSFFCWGRLASLLDLVDSQDYWRNEAADSYTEWLKCQAHKLATTPASLWRYLSAGRFYNKLLTDHPSLAEKALEELGDDLSPESLELLAKISRVAPDNIYRPLVVRLLTGEIKRSELRSTWSAFRPVLEGKTARGRGVAAPKVNSENSRENERMALALVQNQLSGSDASWLQLGKLHSFATFFDLSLSHSSRFDTVIVAQDSEMRITMHGVEICCKDRGEPAFIHKIETLADKCDILWIALPFVPKETFLHKVPLHIGVIKVDTNGIETIRAPKLTKRTNDTDALSRALLAIAIKH